MEIQHIVQEALTTTVGNPPGATSTWDKARKWAAAATQFERAGLACQVMAGFELIALHEQHQIKRGQPKKVFVGNRRILFRELIEQELPIRTTTAGCWMRMARAIKARFSGIDAPDQLRALLKLPPDEWTSEVASQMSTFVHEITDGKTQSAFLRELGLVKKRLPRPPQLTAGATHGLDASPRAEAAHGKRQGSLDNWPAEHWALIRRALIEYGPGFTHLSDDRIQDQINLLDYVIQIRRNWLNLYPELRDPAHIGPPPGKESVAG